MAAAIVPLVASAIPVVAPLIAKLLEKIFPPKSGAAKLDVGTEILAAIQTGLQTAGAPTAPLSGDQLKAALQGVVSDLNAKNQLVGSATVIDPSACNSNLGDLLIYLGNAMKGSK